jgi:virginiamycin A acetyltransferase
LELKAVMTGPDKDQKFTPNHNDKLRFLKNILKNPNIVIGYYTYDDNVEDFEKKVKDHFDFIGDKLMIGKFCMIASNVTLIMNGANHLTDALTTYPFAVFENGWENVLVGKAYPQKVDVNIGNHFWIGYKATTLAGVTIDNRAIIATNSAVIHGVEPYSIVGGNPANVKKKRFAVAKLRK